jgi:lysophospholipase L1-like esterase
VLTGSGYSILTQSEYTFHGGSPRDFFLLLTLGCGSGIFLPPLNTPQTNDVVFIGDSITYLWSQDPAFQTHTDWINKGSNGQTSYQIAQRFATDAIQLHPRMIHILVGSNDVYPGWQSCGAPTYGLPAPQNTCSNIVYMVQTAQHYGIKVVLGTIPPWGCSDDPHCGLSALDETAARYTRIVELNHFVKAFAAEQGLTVVDYHALFADATGLHYEKGLSLDGIHPTMQGYELITPAVAAAVE